MRGLHLCKALLLVVAVASSAWSLPPIPGYLKDAVAGSDELKPFAATLEATKSKCDVCHKPGVEKKAKGHGLNDYGRAFHKHLNDKAFMSAHKEKEADKAKQLIVDAWTKTLEEKNEAGETFGSLIKAGKLPGKND